FYFYLFSNLGFSQIWVFSQISFHGCVVWCTADVAGRWRTADVRGRRRLGCGRWSAEEEEEAGGFGGGGGGGWWLEEEE
ncbi:hypothetical protein LINPERHAP1_LOCUS39715, partial [Linum perenne]